jgi:hemerythrin-like domain-containing protein
MATTKRTTTSAKRTTRKVAKKVKRKAPQVAKRTAKAASTGRTAAKRTAKRATTAAAKKTAPAKRASSPGTGDAIALLKRDHQQVNQLFKRLEKAGAGAHRTKRALMDSVIEELSRHAGIEELVFYPALRKEMRQVESDVLEALEEHHLVKLSLRELEDLDPADERFDAKVTVLIEIVRHHVKEEENELFPDVRKQLGRKRLQELGDELRAARRRAPTRPHPGAPDEPPGNLLVGGAVAVVDRARTVGHAVVERVKEELPTP